MNNKQIPFWEEEQFAQLFKEKAEDVKIEKPNPEGLLWAIEHLGIENVLYVVDIFNYLVSDN